MYPESVGNYAFGENRYELVVGVPGTDGFKVIFGESDKDNLAQIIKETDEEAFKNLFVELEKSRGSIRLDKVTHTLHFLGPYQK